MNSVISVIIEEAVWLSGVRALDLKPGDAEFKSPSDHQLDLFQGTYSLWFNSLAALVNSELVCL